MSQLLSTTIKSSLDQLVQQFCQPEYKDRKLELWTFNDSLSRLSAQNILMEYGVDATIYSAYKPLLHFFLEKLSVKQCQFDKVEIQYPVHSLATENRFLLEAYPLAALIEADDVQFLGNTLLDNCYQITLTFKDQSEQQYSVFAPNRVKVDAMGCEQLSPSAWVKEFDEQGHIVNDKPLIVDYEQTYDCVIDMIKLYPWPSKSPYFHRLELHIQVPVQDEAVGYEHEVISLQEALHEDLYFSIQEHFKALEGKKVIARDSQPGQIVPFITYSDDGNYHIEAKLKSYHNSCKQQGFMAIDQASGPLSVGQVLSELNDLGGEQFQVSTVTGNTVRATYIKGSDKPVFVSGGQHANETTGVVGALRAAKKLLEEEESHLVISPLANPDGYALYHDFIKDNPHHMHHAARYTALGDDLEYRSSEPLYEKGMRNNVVSVSGAQLHINLHGYPSHEWTRPFSGYVPQGFDMWTIPKGFFLVIRHSAQAEWVSFAERFVNELTHQLQSCTEVLAMNQKQIALYEKHAGETGFRMINGFPCFVSAEENPQFPLQLITEYPDESIYGEDFIMGHEAQMETVLAAYRVYQLMN